MQRLIVPPDRRASNARRRALERACQRGAMVLSVTAPPRSRAAFDKARACSCRRANRRADIVAPAPFARMARETFGSTRPRAAGMRVSTSCMVAPCAPTPGARMYDSGRRATVSAASSQVAPTTAPIGPSESGLDARLRRVISRHRFCATVSPLASVPSAAPGLRGSRSARRRTRRRHCAARCRRKDRAPRAPRYACVVTASTRNVVVAEK